MNSIIKEKRYISDRIGVPYESLSQSYLRSEFDLTNKTLSVADFALQRNKVQTPNITERLLDLNDEFVITHFNISLVNYQGSDTDLTKLTKTLQTYESPGTFGSGYGKLRGVYNGDLNFTIDRTEFIPAFPCSAFRRVPLTQITSANGGTVPVQNAYDNGLYGFYPSEPTIINGRQTIDLSVDLGTAINFASLLGIAATVVFEARGYLVVNAK
jgi:hypothetical protein